MNWRGIFAATLMLAALLSARADDEWPEYTSRESAWTAGEDHFICLRLPKPLVAAAAALAPTPWPASSHLTVSGVPFELGESAATVLATRTENEETVALSLPANAKEILLLLAADFPAEERFAEGENRPIKLDVLDEPERMTLELLYADGTSDEMLPVHAATASYGVRHGIALYALHTAPGQSPTRLVLHDRMRNAAFGILAVTVNDGAVRVPEPTLPLVWYPAVKKANPSAATLGFDTQSGFTWNGIESAMLGGHLDLSNAPVFIFKLSKPGQTPAERDIPSSQWRVEQVRQADGDCEATLSYQADGVSLRATFAARPLQSNETQLTLQVVNAGTNAVAGTLLFPTVSNLRIGSLEDTWYFASRLGGVINHIPIQFRDRIGELHPLQVDGFFNPKLGAGLAFLPRDMEDLHRWYQVGKDTNGGRYALEFMPRTVPPGGA